jgi:hypothetical protein
MDISPLKQVLSFLADLPCTIGPPSICAVSASQLLLRHADACRANFINVDHWPQKESMAVILSHTLRLGDEGSKFDVRLHNQRMVSYQLPYQDRATVHQAPSLLIESSDIYNIVSSKKYLNVKSFIRMFLSPG